MVSDKTDEILKFCELTQEEYIKKLSKLKKILIYKWKQERRIDCIKVYFFIYFKQFNYLFDIY